MQYKKVKPPICYVNVDDKQLKTFTKIIRVYIPLKQVFKQTQNFGILQ